MHVHQSWMHFGLIVGLIASFAGLPAASGMDGDPSDKPLCEVAREWVLSKNGILPTTLDQIERYPLIYRRAIYNELSMEVRAQLWRTHLTEMLRTNSRLSDDQKSFLRSAIDQAPEILHADEETMDSWDLQIAELFSRADAREIFGTLGAMNAVGTAESLLAEGVIVDESITASAASASGAGACECSESGTNYCWFTYCNKGTCQSAPSGCGTWWQQPCDGMCGGPRPVE